MEEQTIVCLSVEASTSVFQPVFTKQIALTHNHIEAVSTLSGSGPHEILSRSQK